MVKEFEKKSVFISKVYYCPHHPEFSGVCECRKPKSKMIFDAQKEFDIDLTKSILVGDKNSDIEAGLNAGIKMSNLIQTGHDIIKNEFNVTVFNSLIELKDEWRKKI